jgi:tripartite-type tricarboxylate transporter receptor subunit TctC
MRGDLDGMCMNWDSIIKQVDASEGKLVPVLIASESRLPKLPNVPTTKEMGLVLSPGVLDVMGSGNAIVAPPRLPAEVRNTLEKAVSMAINDPETERQMQKANYTVKPIVSPKETKELALRVFETYVKNKDLLQTVR